MEKKIGMGIFLKFKIKTKVNESLLNFRIKIDDEIVIYKLRANQEFHELINIFIKKGSTFEFPDKDIYEFEYEISKTPFWDENILKKIEEGNLIVDNNEIYYNKKIYGNPTRLVLCLTSPKIDQAINQKYEFIKGEDFFFKDNTIYLSLFDLYNINGTGFLANNYEEPLLDKILELINSYIEKYKIDNIYIIASYKASLTATLVAKKIQNSKLFLISPFTKINEYFANQDIHLKKFYKKFPLFDKTTIETTIFYSIVDKLFLELDKFQNSKNICLNVENISTIEYVLEEKLILKETLEDFNLKYIREDNNSKKVVFIFQSSNPDSKNNQDYRGFVKKNSDFDFIWVQDSYEMIESYPGWYIEKHGFLVHKIYAKKVDKLIKRYKYREAFAMGSSKGGTGALIIGSNSMYISKIFSIIPQIDLFNADMKDNIEGEVKKVFSNKSHLKQIIEKNIAASNEKNIIILSGSNEFPNLHYQRSKEMLLDPNNNSVRLLCPVKFNFAGNHFKMIEKLLLSIEEVMRIFFKNDINQEILNEKNIGNIFHIFEKEDVKKLYGFEKKVEKYKKEQINKLFEDKNL